MQQDEHSSVPEDGRHVVAEDLDGAWLPELVEKGTAEIEAYLAKHAAFLRYLEKRKP